MLTPHRHRAFVLARSREDYSDEDLEVARRIQPLPVLLERQVQVLQGGTASLASDVGREVLTGRERAVLVLLERGCTAEAIAHRLEISPRTVHKHLEHLYRKVGVSDRLRAVTVAREARLLAEPHGIRWSGRAPQGARATGAASAAFA